MPWPATALLAAWCLSVANIWLRPKSHRQELRCCLWELLQRAGKGELGRRELHFLSSVDFCKNKREHLVQRRRIAKLLISEGEDMHVSYVILCTFL